jgi:hypothetical protein
VGVKATAIVLGLAMGIVALACARVQPQPEIAGGSGGGAGGARGGGGGAGGFMPGGGHAGMGIMVDGAGDAMCGLQTFDLARRPVEIFLVLDRSGSMKDDAAGDTASPPANPSKWSQLIPALSTAITQADPSIAWGMKTFPEDGSDCTSGTVTPKIDVPIAPMNAAALNAAVVAPTLTPDGNGTPTAAAIGVAVDYLKSLNDGNRKYILLATDGEPSCAGAAGALSKDSSNARIDAVAAVTAAAGADIHTFVLGVATTKANDTSTLNMLAVAGLEPQQDFRPGATRFYLASNQDQLVAALLAIVNPIASSCVFPLASPPPDPENIAVKVNGMKAPMDITHAGGWDYTDAKYSGVQVYGSWCDTIRSVGNQVEIIFGCKDIIIP